MGASEGVPRAQAPWMNRQQLWPPPGNNPVPLKERCPGMQDRRWDAILERLANHLLIKYKYVYYFSFPEPRNQHSVPEDQPPSEHRPDLSDSVLALLTEIEPVHPDGRRLPIAERGSGLAKIRPRPPRTWGELLWQMIGKPPGRYRMILVVLKPTSGLPPSKRDPDWDEGIAESAALDPFGWLPAQDTETIKNALPKAMRSAVLGDGNVWVVVYDIERQRGGSLKPNPRGDNWFKSLHDSELEALLGPWPALTPVMDTAH